MSLLLWVLAPIATTIAMVFVQGLVLQGACALADEPPPRYPNAVVTALIGGLFGGIATGLFRYTLGLVVGLFISWTLAWIAGLGLGLAVTAGVYRSRLRLSVGSALKVALVHYLLSAGISAVVWAIAHYWPF